MPSNTVTYLNAVSAQLKAHLSLNSAELHGGTFNLKEVRDVARNAPCAFIALLDLPDNTTGKQSTCPTSHRLNPVVFLFATGNDRNEHIIDLATNAKHFIHGNQFNQSFATAARGVRAKNLYTQELGQLGVAAWVLNFQTDIG